MHRGKKKLQKLLEENVSSDDYVRVINEEIFGKLNDDLRKGKYLLEDDVYNPLLEIAKVALTTTDEDVKVRCNTAVAQYMYPKVKSLEIKSTEDKNVNVNIRIEGYAQLKKVIEIEPEEVELEDDEDAGREFRLDDFRETDKKIIN